ncbi:ExbD/TolR family protein [Verrucomicrobiota bacterium]
MKISRDNDGLNMTPMIDVVFQLIIFFVVTISISSKYNETIELTKTPHGDTQISPNTMTIEVDKRGWISINGTPVSYEALDVMLDNRRNRIGTFPVMIRGDNRTKHADIESVLNLCGNHGIHQIKFATKHDTR